MPQRQHLLQRWASLCGQSARVASRFIVELGALAQSLVAIVVFVAVLLEVLHLLGITPWDVRQVLQTVVSAP